MIRLLPLLVAVALSGCRVSGVQAYTGRADRPAVGPSVVLLSWNTQKGRHADLTSDLELVLAERHPDLVFLQEARRDFAVGEGMDGYFARSWTLPGLRRGPVGVATLSRVPARASKPMPTRWREFFVTAPKVSLLTWHLLSDGRTLATVNTHCLNFERWGTMKLRSQVECLVEALDGHDGPIVVCGDFNTWNAKRLRVVEDLAARLCLSEVRSFPHGRKTAATESTCLDWVLGIDPELALDRIYYRGLTLRSCDVLTDYRSSDHVGLVAEFEI